MSLELDRHKYKLKTFIVDCEFYIKYVTQFWCLSIYYFQNKIIFIFYAYYYLLVDILYFMVFI